MSSITEVSKVVSGEPSTLKHTRPETDEQSECKTKIAQAKENALSPNESSPAKTEELPCSKSERKIEDVKALITSSVNFRSLGEGSEAAFSSSAIAEAITSSQTTASDLSRLTEILPEEVIKADVKDADPKPQSRVKKSAEAVVNFVGKTAVAAMEHAPAAAGLCAAFSAAFPNEYTITATAVTTLASHDAVNKPIKKSGQKSADFKWQ